MGVMVTVLETGYCSFTQTIFLLSLVCLDEFRIFLHPVSSLNITLPSSLPLASVSLKFTQEVAATLCCLHILEAFSEDVNLVVNSVQSPVSEILPHLEASVVAIGNSELAEITAWFLFSLTFIKTKIEPLPLCVLGQERGAQDH